MCQLFFSESCPFNFDDWNSCDIKQIFAGNACVMAINNDGEVLQKVLDENFSARTKYWKNIKSISISNLFSSLAVGLVNDGTCIVSKRALRRCCEITERNFEHINEQIKALNNIVEIAVSDAIFALDSYGKVHHIPLRKDDSYKDLDTWYNICHIAVGNQDSVFGITQSGTLLSAGNNCISGPHGNIQCYLSKLQNVIDVCSMGSECEHVMIALDNGTVVDYSGEKLNIEHCGKWPVFVNNFLFAVTQLNNDKLRCDSWCYDFKDIATKIENQNVKNIAIGISESSKPFVVGLLK